MSSRRSNHHHQSNNTTDTTNQKFGIFFLPSSSAVIGILFLLLVFFPVGAAAESSSRNNNIIVVEASGGGNYGGGGNLHRPLRRCSYRCRKTTTTTTSLAFQNNNNNNTVKQLKLSPLPFCSRRRTIGLNNRRSASLLGSSRSNTIGRNQDIVQPAGGGLLVSGEGRIGSGGGNKKKKKHDVFGSGRRTVHRLFGGGSTDDGDALSSEGQRISYSVSSSPTTTTIPTTTSTTTTTLTTMTGKNKESDITTPPPHLEEVIRSMEQLHASGINNSLQWRIKQLQSMKRMLTLHENEFVQALQLDLDRTRDEALLTEITLVHKEIDHLLAILPTLIHPEKVSSPGHLVPCYSEIRRVPLRPPGCLIIGPFNYPIQLTLVPALGSLAGGNPTVIKPSELCPCTSKLLATLIPRYFDRSALSVIEGGIDITTTLLQQSWGLIFFTGSTRVGRIIAKAAADTLTPTVLELGGKSPVYISEKCPDMTVVADRIAWSKTVNSGQTCVAPDYVLCHESVLDEFCVCIAKSIRKMHYNNTTVGGVDDGGDGGGGNGDGSGENHPARKASVARIVSTSHAERLIGLIRDTEEKEGSRIIIGGSKYCNAKSRFVTPTVLVLPPSPSSSNKDDNQTTPESKSKPRLMEEEIFGPVLPILSVSSTSEAISYINNQQGTPLVLYVFTTSSETFEHMITQCPSAASSRNDVLVHFSSCYLPIGGLGTSGWGTYHGVHSFQTFTHGKAVLYKPAHKAFEYFGARYPPYDDMKTKILLALMNLPPVPVIFRRRSSKLVISSFFVIVAGCAITAVMGGPSTPAVRIGFLRGMKSLLDHLSSMITV